MSAAFAEGHCTISGIGISEVGRRLDVDPLRLTAQAAIAALRDALGAGRGVPSATGTGMETAGALPGDASAAAWTSPTWPLRYDRVVRRWLAETAATEASRK